MPRHSRRNIRSRILTVVLIVAVLALTVDVIKAGFYFGTLSALLLGYLVGRAHQYRISAKSRVRIIVNSHYGKPGTLITGLRPEDIDVNSAYPEEITDPRGRREP